MQESKPVDFNPLDILATAAVLQRVDSKGNKVTSMTQQNSDTDNEDQPDQTTNGQNQNAKSQGNGIRKLKVMFTSQLDKMLDEHNYGNARKNKLCTLNTDVSPQGKDRKVIVALVDKSGDHHVLKTIQTVKYLSDKSENNISDSDENKSHVNSEGFPKDSITHCNSSDVNESHLNIEGTPGGSSPQTSPDTQTEEINKLSDQETTKQDIPEASQKDINKENEIENKNSQKDMCGDCYNRDLSQDDLTKCNSNKTENSCDNGHVRMITKSSDPDVPEPSQPQTYVINISHQGGVLSSQLERQQKKDNSHSKTEIPEVKHQIIRTLLMSSQNKGVCNNNIGEQNRERENIVDQNCTCLCENNCDCKYSKERDSELSSKMCFSDSIQINSNTKESITESECDKEVNRKNILVNETLNIEGNKWMASGLSNDDGIANQTTEITHLSPLSSGSSTCFVVENDTLKECETDSQLVHAKSESSVEDDNCENYSEKITESRSHVHPGVDHCYAGVLNKPSSNNHLIDNMDDSSLDGIGYDDSESPQSAISDLSQDSGFSDSGHSPDVESESNKFVHSQYLNRQKETPQSSHLFLSDSKKPVAILEIPPPAIHTSSKVGKYRIGTFASVSNSAMGLESPKSKSQLLSRLKPNRKRPASLLTSPVYSSSLLTENLELYNNQAQCADEKYAVPGTPVMKSDIEHDHDYCLPWDNHASSVANSPSSKLLKDASCRDVLSIKQKDKKSESSEKRRRMSSASSDKDYIGSMDDTDLSSPDSLLGSPLPSTLPQSLLQPNSRHRVKLEKIADYVKSGNSDSKLKITGSFQDDYIYFLNTKSRSRRRTSHDVKPPVPSDKILIPLPKPGDIVVPHLTDADLEAIKQRRNVTKKSVFQSPPIDSQFLPPQPPVSSVQTTSTALSSVSNSETRTESTGDEDSKNIIDTILSLESGEPSSYSGQDTAPAETSNYGDNFVMSFSPEQMNLTPEQMEILYSAMDQVSETEIKSNGSDETKTIPLAGKAIDSPSESSTEENPAIPDVKGISVVEQQPDTFTSGDVLKDSSTSPNTHVADTSLNQENTGGSLCEDQNVSKAVPVTKASVPTSSLIEPLKTTVTSVSSVTPSSGSHSVVNSLPELPFTSMDKSSLDLFGNELKLFPEASVPETNLPTASNDYDAPWIVTVSMYWNDLPAIMIDNLPFVRLVDIHKQILPAKDTGILKKRCQLLGIDVKNCSEMQRYFLVQYGKAFNSKSTLIVSKEDASSLIGYYVNPVPKLHRSETEKSDRQKMIESGSHHRHTKSSARSKHHDIDSIKPETLPHDQKTQVITPTPTAQQAPPPPEVPSTVPPLNDSPKQHEQVSRRTRHKKINFLEMLKGDQNNNTSDQQDDISISVDDKEQVKSKSKDSEKSEKIKNSTSRKKSPVAKDTSKVAGSVCQASQDEQSCNESETENRSFSKDAIFINPKRKLCSFDTKRTRLDKTKKSGTLKVKWTIFNKNQINKKKLIESKHEKREILSVIHKDSVVRNGNKSRVQSGSVFLDQFEARDSACVRCCTCKKFISIENFLNHLHEVGGSGKLIAINEPQTLALRDMYPSDAQKRLWKSFQEKLRHLKKVDKEGESKTEEKRVFVKERVSESTINAGTSETKKPNDCQHVGSTRISSRKRKQKQLYPIENYSFSKSQPVRKLIDSDDEPPRSPLLERSCDTYDDSPVKQIKLDTNHNDSDIAFPSHLSSKMECESVLTLTNGPEMTSFTALADESFDL